MNTTHSMRRSSAPFVQLLVAAVLAVACAGCGPEGEGAPVARGAATMNDEEYVSCMAALTVAVEEGLSGEEAASRAVELGSSGRSREEIETFLDVLREDPERWVRTERRVEEKAEELRRTAREASAP